MNTNTETNQEPTAEDLVDAITGRPLVDMPNLLDSDRCKRCESKNDVRLKYDIPRRKEEFEDGERVRLLGLYDPDDEGRWVLTGAYHRDHPQKEKAEVAVPDLAQAMVTARVDRDGWTYTIGLEEEVETYHVEDRCVVYDVEVEWVSPIGEGEEREPIREPGEHGMIELKPTDPRPNWPAEDNEWREELMREHGDWNDGIPTYSIGGGL